MAGIRQPRFSSEYYPWNYNVDSSKIKDAHAWCKSETESRMHVANIMETKNPGVRHNLVKIFVANTFTQEWEMEDYINLAKKYGYDVVTLIVENRHGGQNVHNVPDSTLEKMKNRFEIKL